MRNLASGKGSAEVKRKVIYISNGELALHSWEVESPSAIVFYIHGLQSHASWSWEFALDFTEDNISFFCMDRFSSGLSKGDHDVFPECGRILTDYKFSFDYISTNNPNTPIIAVGHCLGGSILTALLFHFNDIARKVSSIFIISSWLAKNHEILTDEDILNLDSESDDDFWSFDFKSEDFSHSEKYRKFIEEDPLAMRGVKKSSRKNILNIEKEYVNLNVNSTLKCANFVISSEDPIVSKKSAINQFYRIYGNNSSVHVLECSEHYLPFSSQRIPLVKLISNFTRGDAKNDKI